MSKLIFSCLCIIIGSSFLLHCTDSSSSSSSDSSSPSTSSFILPNIASFNSIPSDQFLVSINVIVDGHMYRGQNANDPHTGGHAHFSNPSSEWPKEGIDLPENYPPIHAISDGIVTKIDTYYPVASNYRYGVTLAIATSNEGTFTFSYSIEPMINPEDSNFYKPYVIVDVDDVVSKGDIIAYMYLIPTSNTNAHIHFNMLHSTGGPSTFIAPIIFTDSIVDAFHEKISTENGGFRNFDGGHLSGTWMENCLGYKISASENPFSNAAADCIR